MLALRSSISAFVTCLSISSFSFTLGLLHELCHLSHGNCVLREQGRACGLDLQGCLLYVKEQLQQSSFLGEGAKVLSAGIWQPWSLDKALRDAL